MINVNEIRNSLTDEDIEFGTAAGISLTQCIIADLQKEYGSAPILASIPRMACVDEMWNMARYWSARAQEEIDNNDPLQAFSLLRARLYMRIAIMVMRENGEWWDFPHAQ